MRVPRPSRFHGFLLASAALIAALVVVSGVVKGRLFEAHLLSHEEEQTAEVVRSQARRYLTPAEFTPPLSARQGVILQTFFEGLPGIFRIKVFDSRGRIVWSNEPRLIGLVFPDNAYLARALTGEVATVLEAPRRTEHVFERTRSWVAEAYVPITFAGRPAVVGVIETYKDMTAVFRAIRRTQRVVWAVAAGLGALLYVALALVVWNASASERRAIGRLEESRAELAAKAAELERTNRALREAQDQLVEKERLAAVGELVVALHHAILNPLTGVIGALEVLKQEGMANAGKAPALAEAEAEIRKLELLVRRLPLLQRTGGTRYVGGTTMLDLERSCGREEPP